MTPLRGLGKRLAGGLLAAACAVLATPGFVAGAVIPHPVPPGRDLTASSPWWQLVAFPGRAVTRVSVVQGRVVAVVDGTAMGQTSGGFTPAAMPAAPPARVSVGSTTWSIDPAGHILVSADGRGARLDPGSPDLGAGAHLIAAPRVVPGAVLAVSTSGLVWSRSPAGIWSLSLFLLPRTLLTGTPAITSIAAFNQSTQSGVVYIGTSGYGTLLTGDGGADWTRAGPGLPSDVRSLAADPSGAGAVWAGTGQGLYVHRLQPLPAVPSYSGGSLTGKWVLTGLLCAAVVLIAAAGLAVWARRTAPPPARLA